MCTHVLSTSLMSSPTPPGQSPVDAEPRPAPGSYVESGDAVEVDVTTLSNPLFSPGAGVRSQGQGREGAHLRGNVADEGSALGRVP